METEVAQKARGTTLALTDLAYADDIAILGDSYEAVQEMVNGVHRFANAVGLLINADQNNLGKICRKYA